MTKLDEMWAALAAYQPQADAAGHGESWARMCANKTSAYAAAAYAAAAYAADAAAYAADADAADVAAADRWAQKAIDRIKKITTPPAAPVQDGWISVPVTLTNDMTSAMADALEDPNNERSSWDLAENMWRAMLTVSPTPPAAQRKPLTDEQIESIAAQTLFPVNFARAIEAKLKEKNHD